MIPKIIHYCWFGGSEIPQHLQKCMDSWSRLLPEYRIMRWDETNFDINSIVWTKEAYGLKKYAFVSDYVRLLALEKYGGIYFDTDVMVKKSFDSLLDRPAFMGFENHLYLTSAVMGFEPHFPLLKEFIDSYKDKTFINADGSINNTANVVMMTDICKKYGLIINNQFQTVAGIEIYPTEYFCPLDFYHNDNTTSNTMAVHLFDASWLEEDTKRMVKKERSLGHKAWIALKRLIKKSLRRS